MYSDPLLQEAAERLHTADRDLDELRDIRENWVLDVYELEVVNDAINDLES